MATLAQFDRDTFLDEYADLEWLESKKIDGSKFGSRVSCFFNNCLSNFGDFDF